MEPILKISGLTVSYPSGLKKEKVALDNLNLEIGEGAILGLLGPNGAGKTTLVKTLIGLIRPKNGEVLIFGEDPSSRAVRKRIGYMPEVAYYPWFLTPEETLRMFGRICGIDKKTLAGRIDTVLKTVGLIGEKRQLIKNFSKGMQERLNVAQALLHDAELFILDEPFSGLDPLGRIDTRNILNSLKKQNKTILLSSHELSEAELICDYVCIMREGRVLKYGPMKELLQARGEKSLEQYFIKMIGEENG